MNKEKQYILTKEDFEGKCIKIPEYISKKKFNKIKAKFKRFGFEVKYIRYSDIEKCSYIFIDYYDGWVLMVEKYSEYRGPNSEKINFSNYIDTLQQISIKDFLAEPKETKLKTEFKNLNEFITYLVDNGVKKKNIKVENDFFLSKTRDAKLIKFSFPSNYEFSWFGACLQEIKIGKYFSSNSCCDYVSECGKVSVELRLEDEQEYEEKYSYYYESFQEILDTFFLNVEMSSVHYPQKPLEFFIIDKIAHNVANKLLETKSERRTILGNYIIKEITLSPCETTKGYKFSIKFAKIEEYEKSKVKLHDLFVEIDGQGMNKYNIDKIYPTKAMYGIKLCVIHKDPNNNRWINYKTKKTRDEDYEKLLKIKGQ